MRIARLTPPASTSRIGLTTAGSAPAGVRRCPMANSSTTRIVADATSRMSAANRSATSTMPRSGAQSPTRSTTVPLRSTSASSAAAIPVTAAIVDTVITSRSVARRRTPSTSAEASSGSATHRPTTAVTIRPPGRRGAPRARGSRRVRPRGPPAVVAMRRSSTSSSTRSSPVSICWRRASASTNRVSPNEITIAVSDSACGSGLDMSGAGSPSTIGGEPAGPPDASSASTAAWPSRAKPSTMRLSDRDVTRKVPAATRPATAKIIARLTPLPPGRCGARRRRDGDGQTAIDERPGVESVEQRDRPGRPRSRRRRGRTPAPSRS